MAEQKKGLDRVTLGRGSDVCIMGIDGTCSVMACSQANSIRMRCARSRARSRVSTSRIFLLLSSTGLAYRSCELVRVNGSDMNIQFLQTRAGKIAQ